MGIAQMIYAFAAVAVAAFLSSQFFISTHAARSSLHRNEILTQVSGISTDLIEDIGGRSFDRRTREDLYANPPPTADLLTDPSAFGGVSAETCSTMCKDIDDFHGLTFERRQGGFDFRIAISVRYVNPDQPQQVSAGKTFAKEVRLSITNPNIHRASRPDSLIPIEISRVFTYLQTL